jgi:hypothetical protein
MCASVVTVLTEQEQISCFKMNEGGFPESAAQWHDHFDSVLTTTYGHV